MTQPMKIPIPSTISMKFNDQILQNGTPISYKYQQNTHHFLALVQEYGPYFISIAQGSLIKTIEVDEITSGSCEIIPLTYLSNDEGQEIVPEPIVVDCTVFDVTQIPVGAIFVDVDGTSFMIQEIDPFCLTLMSHENERVTVYSEVFFSLDEDEVEGFYIILPPLIVEALMEQAVSYKERV